MNRITREHADALFRAICTPSLIHSDEQVVTKLAELLTICRELAGEPKVEQLVEQINQLYDLCGSCLTGACRFTACPRTTRYIGTSGRFQ